MAEAVREPHVQNSPYLYSCGMKWMLNFIHKRHPQLEATLLRTIEVDCIKDSVKAAFTKVVLSDASIVLRWIILKEIIFY